MLAGTVSNKVKNPQDEYDYYWPRRDVQAVRAAVNNGWEVVPPDAPEFGDEELDEATIEVLKDLQRDQDVILMRRPKTESTTQEEETPDV